MSLKARAWFLGDDAMVVMAAAWNTKITFLQLTSYDHYSSGGHSPCSSSLFGMVQPALASLRVRSP
jgi:hypothetical protein